MKDIEEDIEGTAEEDDPKRPVFHRFANVADEISRVFGRQCGEKYWPDQGLWSKDESDGNIR
jgi:hypothetical protein